MLLCGHPSPTLLSYDYSEVFILCHYGHPLLLPTLTRLETSTLFSFKETICVTLNTAQDLVPDFMNS